MAKYCPEQNRKVLYLDCLECETKSCRKNGNADTGEKEEKKK